MAFIVGNKFPCFFTINDAFFKQAYVKTHIHLTRKAAQLYPCTPHCFVGLPVLLNRIAPAEQQDKVDELLKMSSLRLER